jgi:hypothetical protein
MPRPKGFEPYTNLWVVQVRNQYPTPTSVFSCQTMFLSCRYFFSLDQYLAWKQWQASQPLKLPYTYVVSDYGRQHWYNDKLWIQTQLQNLVINGNFQPDLQP